MGLGRKLMKFLASIFSFVLVCTVSSAAHTINMQNQEHTEHKAPAESKAKSDTDKDKDWDREVILRVVLQADGRVGNIEVIKAGPEEYTKRAIEAAKQIKFTPAVKDGHPVSQYVTISYRFDKEKD